MSRAAFIDANIPLYAAGKSHPLKSPCIQIMRLAAEHPLALVTDAEVLQELLHHYLVLRQWTRGRQVFGRFHELMQERVEPISAADVQLASTLADSHSELNARDLLHAAVMHRLGVRRVVSADAHFDRLLDVDRLDPAKIDNWRDSVTS